MFRIFSYFGAFVRWVFNILRLLYNPKKTDDMMDNASNELINSLLGLAFFAFIFMLLSGDFKRF